MKFHIHIVPKSVLEVFSSVIHNCHFTRCYLLDPSLFSHSTVMPTQFSMKITLYYWHPGQMFSSDCCICQHLEAFLQLHVSWSSWMLTVLQSLTLFFLLSTKKALMPLNVTFCFARSQLLLGDQMEMLPTNTLLNFSLTSFVSSLVLHRPLNPSKVVLSLPTFFSLCNISNVELFPSTKWSLGSQYLNLNVWKVHCFDILTCPFHLRINLQMILVTPVYQLLLLIVWFAFIGTFQLSSCV